MAIFREQTKGVADTVITSAVVGGGSLLLALVSSYIASRLGANEYLVFAIGVFVFFLVAVLVNRYFKWLEIDRQFRKAFLFKSSPLFTGRRKRRMKKHLLQFREYLTSLGLDLPPYKLAISVGSGASHAVGPTAKRVGVGAEGISLRVERVTEKSEITESYARYVMSKALTPTVETILDPSQHNTAEFSARMVVQGDLATYFNRSFWRQKPERPRGWLAALWDIRETFGQDFADSLVAHAVQSFEDGYAPRKFANYRFDENLITLPNQFLDYVIYCHLEQAEKRVDNSDEKLPKIREILTMHGLSVP